MQSRNGKRGSILLEFALSAGFVLIPLGLGTTTVGMTLARTLRVYHLNRDAGHMFARGVDFTLPGSRQLLLRLANGLNITDSGGNGVIILSQIACSSGGQLVCTRRIVIGNAGLRTSAYANPSLIDGDGNVDFANDPDAAAETFRSVMAMTPGESAYVVETYFSATEFDWIGFLSGTGIRTMGVF
jgi:hypothetical protein